MLRRTISSSLFALAFVVAGFACGKDGPTTPPVGVNSGSIVVGPSPAWLARGAAMTLRIDTYDASGARVPDATLTVTSSDASVATVSGSGIVTGMGNGTATIVATTADGRHGSAVVNVVDARPIAGSVQATDGGTLGGLQFTARFGSGAGQEVIAAPIDPATGRFALVVPALPGAAGQMELFVDAIDASARRYHPSWQLVAAGQAPPSALSVLLVPEVMVPDSGTYAGLHIPVSLDRAFTPVCTDTSNVNCQSFWPSYWTGGIKMWPDAARPIPLAIDHTGAGASIVADDSVTLWTAIRTMEADLGRRLFEPAPFTGYTTPGYQAGAVLVTLDPTLSATAAFTNWSWNGAGEIFQARTRFGSMNRGTLSGLAPHELTHAQGFSHTCQWSTVMGGYGCPTLPRYSESDVGYHQLAQMLRRRTLEVRPTWGLAEALAGERVLERGITVSQALSAEMRAARQRIPVAGTDSSGRDGAP